MYLDSFTINGDPWTVEMVEPNDYRLIDRTGTLTIATTDPDILTIYLSNTLKGSFLMTVFMHELTHCTMYSYDLLTDLHRMVPEKYWINVEEYICNLLADYGLKIYAQAYKTLGTKAWRKVPERLGTVIMRR